ncbi:MAG: FadR family transcriptional regulator [Mameliella sp.]|nr:FadR family transcriptional regulator [Mameliella sp.]
MSHATSRRALWMQKIADQVADTLAEKIRAGTLAPGDSPGSREALMAEFVTVGSVIDKALDDLTERGLLRPGADGAPVVADLPPRAEAFALPPTETLSDVKAVLELRLGLEAVAASLAAERRSPAQLAAIEAAAEAFAHAAPAETAQADFRFHSQIAAASGNAYMSDLLDYLGPLLIPRMRLTLPAAPGETGDRNRERSITEHAAIVAAIAAQDAEAARARMRDHLLRSLALMEQIQTAG